MAKDRRLVLVTGATGNMGRAVVGAILADPDLALRVLVRPEEKRHPVVKQLRRHAAVQIAWGDLTDAGSVAEAVTGADIVLHMGALVSPLADTLPPALVEKVNVGGTRNVVEAIRKQPNADEIRLVYVGTMAQTGSRNPPVHWGRTGDPIMIGLDGHYAGTKAKGEAIVAEAGLRHWVSIRQTGMAHFDLWRHSGPVVFHNPLNGVMEWSTVEDSARLMVALCRDNVPQGLWRGFFNMGGGAEARLVNHEFFTRSMAAIGIDDFRKVLRPNWQATHNFHGQWFLDSDRLEELVPYRKKTMAQFFADWPANVPFAVRAVGRYATGLVRAQIRKLAYGPGGTMRWIEDNDREHIDAYFGSRDAWARIPKDWDAFEFAQPSREPAPLDHGYDDSKPKSEWTIADLRQAAEFRGGFCRADATGDPWVPVEWACASGHSFVMSPNLHLAGGHWCPTCQTDIRSYDRAAARNPFFAQTWQAECSA